MKIRRWESLKRVSIYNRFGTEVMSVTPMGGDEFFLTPGAGEVTLTGRQLMDIAEEITRIAHTSTGR